MKSLTIKSLAVLMMLGAFAMISMAQDIKERVQLNAGGEGKSLTRTLGPNGSLDVTFRANAGQTISFTAGYDFRDSDIQVFLMQTGYQDTLKSSGPKANNEYKVEETGDYHVLVRNMTRKSITTTLYLDLFNPEDMRDDTNSDIQTEALDFTGSDQANVSKTIPANGTMLFTFDGVKGSTAIIKVTDRTNKLTVIFNDPPTQKADTEIALNTDVSRKLTKTAKYTVEVGNFTDKAIKFDLEVSIELASSTSTNNSSSADGNTVRVQFGRGETSASVTKEIPANGSVDFLINARKGQTLGYTVGYDFRDSDIEAFLTEPGLQDISKTSGPKEPQEFLVKRTGDHRLTVNNTTNKKVTITLYLDIE